MTILTIDHLFVLTEPNAPREREILRDLGLVETYSRRHPGQGTANVCYCFDNLFVELLWAVDWEEVRSTTTAPTRLAERALWRDNGACPFGLALGGSTLPVPAWDYVPSYLPTGLTIPVAEASKDPQEPFVFQSFSPERPDEWTSGRAGNRQRFAGYTEITQVSITVPGPSPLLDALNPAVPEIASVMSIGPSWRMDLTIQHISGHTKAFTLPIT